jgi:hypothetical protein
MWCGGGHLHKECSRAEKENSTPTAATTVCRKENDPILPVTEAVATQLEEPEFFQQESSREDVLL